MVVQRYCCQKEQREDKHIRQGKTLPPEKEKTTPLSRFHNVRKGIQPQYLQIAC